MTSRDYEEDVYIIYIYTCPRYGIDRVDEGTPACT